MKTTRKPDPERVEQFAAAYVGAVMVAAKELNAWLGPQSMEDYAVAITLGAVDMVNAAGVESIAHYVLNRVALPLTCQALGIENSIAALDDFVGGK